MRNKISVFLPTRKGSERVVNKNTRPFAGRKGGLLALKLEQLLATQDITEIILSTNDPVSIEIAGKFSDHDDRLKIIPRPDELALSSTNLTDLIRYVPTICSQKNILWTHVTSPFTAEKMYSDAIQKYFEVIEKGTFDSLMSVKPFHNFLWSRNKRDIINRSRNTQRWPRTQDLEELFEITSAIFIAPRSVYHKSLDRIGANPFLFEQSERSAFDIDWEHDFELAEKIFKHETNK